MMVLPFPDEESSTITEIESVSLSPGQRATVSFTPTRSSTKFMLGAVAISKRPNSSYTIKLDGTTHFGAEEVPPTDIDDVAAVWIPALPMQDELEVIVEDLRSTGDARTYHVQPIGYEEPNE